MEGTLAARLWRAVQWEDGLLFGWLVVAEPLLSRALGPVMAARSAEAPTAATWLAGAFCYLAALCALLCLATRTAGAPPLRTDDGEFDVASPSGYARLPMIVVLGILLNEAGQLTGLDKGDGFFGVAMLVWFAAFLLQSRLPQVPGFVRRLLMSPAVVFTTWFYTDTFGNVFDGLDLQGALANYGTPEWGMTYFFLCMGGVVTTFAYVMFILAPRQVSGSGGSWFQWGARYLLYLVGIALNIGPLKIIG